MTLVLGELQSEGLVELGRRKLVLIDPPRLAGAADGPPGSQAAGDSKGGGSPA